MYKLTLLFSVLITLNATAKNNNNSDCLNYTNLNSQQHQLEKILFDKAENFSSIDLDVNSIEIIELEEEVEFNFNPKDYLPEGFNALKGKYDLDSHKIQLVLIDID